MRFQNAFARSFRGEYVVIQKEMDEPISLFDLRIDGWDYTTLGEICAKGQGGVQTGPFGSQLHASDYVAEGIPSIMPQNIGDNRIIRDGIARITTEDAERLERYRVRTGDIVYSRRGDVERRALVRSEEDGWLCGTGCLRVRFGSSDVDSAFASFYLGDPRVRSWIVKARPRCHYAKLEYGHIVRTTIRSSTNRRTASHRSNT